MSNKIWFHCWQDEFIENAFKENVPKYPAFGFAVIDGRVDDVPREHEDLRGYSIAVAKGLLASKGWHGVKVPGQ
jgi:hypothetical protein